MPITIRSRSQSLTPEAIVEAAVQLAEAEGPAALSLRKLGDRLGVDATAVYRHFRDKDDIVLAAFDQILAGQVDTLPTADHLDWRARLRLFAENTWQTAEQHPAMFALAAARTTGGPAERRIVEFITATLAETGLPADDVVLCYRMYADAQLALCGIQATMISIGPALRAKDAGAWSRIYAVLPEAEYPAARAHASELARIDDRTIFLGVVDAVLDAIGAMVAAHGSSEDPASAGGPHRSWNQVGDIWSEAPVGAAGGMLTAPTPHPEISE